jgi:hypothetical protein
MKKLPLAVIIGITALLSGCACECDDEYPALQVQFEGFTAAELKTISVIVINPVAQDTCFNCLAFSGNSAQLGVAPNALYQLKSDSIQLNEVIQVNEIRTETAKHSACHCTSVTGLDYEFDGKRYTDQPVVIIK